MEVLIILRFNCSLFYAAVQVATNVISSVILDGIG
jgi:hypothetical protein